MSNKFYARKVVCPEGNFDSMKEYRRWQELKKLEENGEIRNLHRQVKYELIPSQYEGKKLVERAVNYIADFVYEDGLQEIVEDVKGIPTDVYKIKRKLMYYIHGIKVKEV